jgi:MoaA/NifB/PqqE/SkfB family radical SAM enzyme
LKWSLLQMKLFDILTSKSFCALPWVSVSTETNGDIKLCCISDSFIKKENGENFNLGKDSIGDILNSEHLKSIRKDMMEGKLISGCNTCYKNENFGGKNSNRKIYNAHYMSKKDAFLNKVKASIEDYTIPESVEYVDIRFGNLCNLACRSCTPTSSSQFNKEVIQIHNTTPSIQKFHTPVRTDFNDWCNTEMFHSNIDSQLDNITEYYMNGGEPTIIDNNLMILTKMIDQGASKNIIIKFNSNMTNNKKEFYDLLPNFKNVVFMCSIDGYGSVQEYLRYPSKWTQIDENLQTLLSMKMSNLYIRLTSVISNINLEFFPELISYFENLSDQYNVNMPLMPTVLTNPSHMSLLSLPMDYKAYCLEKIETFIEENPRQRGWFFDESIKIIKNQCTEDNDFVPLLCNFFEYNDILDTNRNQSLANVNPRLDGFRNLV